MHVDNLKYSSSDKELMQIYKDLRNEYFIEESIKNFSRFDRLTKLSFLTYLAVKDKLDIESIDKEKTALIFVDENGSTEANLKYYQDYLNCGKILARGNYFIYTLATSPLAEIAIYLGLEGPLQYFASNENIENFVVKQAKSMIKNKEASNVLAFYKDDKLLKIKLIKEDEQE